jgi:hypothetical protein
VCAQIRSCKRAGWCVALEEIVGIVLGGVYRVGIDVEAAVYNDVRGVCVNFSRSGAGVCVTCGRCSACPRWGLNADFANRTVQRRMHEFSVVFVEDLFRDYGGVFALLGKVGREEVGLSG